MKIQKLTQFAATAAVFCAATSYAVSNDALLDLLVEKGVLTDTEATSVAAELKEENKGVSFSSKGKETVKLRFNGRLQFQYDALDAENQVGDKPSTNHFYFRRLRFGAKATHENGLYAETVFDFAGDDLSINKALAGYEYSDALNASFGYNKVPFGFQETTSSSKIKTIERSAANRFFADDIDFSGKHAGLFAKGDLGGGLSYSAALVNSAQGEGSKLMGASNASNDLAYFGRLQWKNDGLTIGVDGGHQSNNYVKSLNDDKEVDPDEPPFDVTAFTGYVNYKFEGLDLLGEYFSGDLGNQGDVDGYALRAAYKMGKFEPVVRYSHVKADTFEIDTDELIRRAPSVNVDGADAEIDSYYVGVNYYHNKAVSLMLGYEIADAEDSAGNTNDVDGLRARVQVLW
jgi:phosphate-selective porin